MTGAASTRLASADRIRRLGAVALPLVPALTVAMYWILSLAAGESLSVAAIYRYGDYNYFPPLAGLAQFNMGEWLVFEHLGEGVRSFPLPSILVHGLAFGLLGPFGLVVADIVVVVAAYFAARRLFVACGLSLPMAVMLALVVSCGLVGWPGKHLRPLEWLPALHLWGLRFPRPFLTDLFLMLCIGCGLRIFVWRKDVTREWALLGLWFGLLLQSRFYSAGTVGLAIGLTAPLLALRAGRFARTARGLCLFAAVTALTLVPFVVQRLLEHPDVPVRMGAFEVERLQPLFLPNSAGPALGASLFALAVGLLVYWIAPPNRRERCEATAGLVAMAGLSVIALPVSIVLLGQTIQPYHFETEAIAFKTLLILVSAGHVLDIAGGWIARWRPNARRLLSPLGALVAAACLILGVNLHREWIVTPLHMRSEFAAYGVRGYRDAFHELIVELQREHYSEARVLGTLDIQVLDWWSLFGGMHSFAPDPLATNLDDDEIEERLLRLLAELGASERQVWRLLHNRAILAFFLGGSKYQLSQAHTYAPLDDYPPQVQRGHARSSPLFSWLLAMPEPEAERLIERYRQLRDGSGDLRLDLIVLGPGPLDQTLAPSRERFRLRFRNEMFRVYQRSENGSRDTRP